MPSPRNGTSGSARLPTERVLSEIIHFLVSERSPERVLEAVADGLREMVPHDTLTLYRADNVLRVLRPVLVRDAYAEEVLAVGPLPFGYGITGTAAESRQPQLVENALVDPRSEWIPDTPDEPESMIAVPLLAGDELKGVLCLYRLGEGNLFTQEDFLLAIRFGEMAALAIDNADIRARLEKEALTDHLTGLYNYRYFHDRIGEEIRRARRRSSTVCLLIYDIDDFKRVNDTRGHLVGDQVLKEVAAISKETCREEDVICRIGGEEFAVILPHSAGTDAESLAERLRAAIAGFSFGVPGRITVSIGVAECPKDASRPRDLIACSDAALFRAKAAGKNRVSVYDSDSGESVSGRDGLEVADPAAPPPP
jgi:diguanylate cyclase (GGDEF)-like protein